MAEFLIVPTAYAPKAIKISTISEIEVNLSDEAERSTISFITNNSRSYHVSAAGGTMLLDVCAAINAAERFSAISCTWNELYSWYRLNG